VGREKEGQAMTPVVGMKSCEHSDKEWCGDPTGKMVYCVACKCHVEPFTRRQIEWVGIKKDEQRTAF
jgi:hypothetical protein